LVSLNFSKTKCVFSVDNNFTHQHIQPFFFFFYKLLKTNMF
jgi:hypothetical protein